MVVLVPERASASPDLSYYTDYGQSREELARAFISLGRSWRWVPVTRETAAATIARLASEAEAPEAPRPVIVNLCDGDDSNDVPGVEVIEHLEAAGLRYTGADAPFYRRTTSKLVMKEAFEALGVPTAPWRAWSPRSSARGILRATGTPAIIKPAISAGSMGVGVNSVVHTAAELERQAAALEAGYLGWNLTSGGVLVERYVAGREFTVLVVGDCDWPTTARVYPPVERVFNRRLPATEQFLSYDRLWEVYEREAPLPGGEFLWEYAPVTGPLAEAIAQVSWQAYAAVGGRGYGRVDVRQDRETGGLFVLEVNAQCGLSEDENQTSVGAILRFAGETYAQLIGAILGHAERRA